ncbi:O-acetylhomoserine/O-acetylserine sulfhydrylase-like pyridoxal-dependent enzyme [Paraburkholderia sp. 40]
MKPAYADAKAGFFIAASFSHGSSHGNLETRTNMDDFHDFDFDTLAVRSGTVRSDFNEHSEAIFLTSSFVFASAADAAERFRNSEDYFTYSRFSNPTVSMFQDRLAALEGGEACIATASGMAAIMSVVMSTLQAGDHLVSSRALFG